MGSPLAPTRRLLRGYSGYGEQGREREGKGKPEELLKGYSTYTLGGV